MSDPILLDPAQLLPEYVSVAQLDAYYAVLMEENRRVNIVSRETSRPDFDRIAAESLLPLRVIPSAFTSYLDIGSGAGFPAIPVLLSRKHAPECVMVERRQRKAAALEYITRHLGLRATILRKAFEETQLKQTFDLITLRWVKLTPSLLTLILDCLAPDGAFVYYSETTRSHAAADAHTTAFRCPQDDTVKSFTVYRKKA
ncbi:MAG: class I SAM-dependent methyltransferase [candidate division Zixibacteria bacterium]|nr:class I SAM-dependent methyltransferase [candidate division Zixibacteria bacterium]